MVMDVTQNFDYCGHRYLIVYYVGDLDIAKSRKDLAAMYPLLSQYMPTAEYVQSHL